MSTYEKLGQYSAEELSTSPKNLVVTDVQSNSISIEWVNGDATGSNPQNIIQLWYNNIWNTIAHISIFDTQYVINQLNSSTEYRIRVAVLSDDVVYPSSPIVETTLVGALNPVIIEYIETPLYNDNTYLTMVWQNQNNVYELEGYYTVTISPNNCSGECVVSNIPYDQGSYLVGRVGMPSCQDCYYEFDTQYTATLVYTDKFGNSTSDSLDFTVTREYIVQPVENLNASNINETHVYLLWSNPNIYEYQEAGTTEVYVNDVLNKTLAGTDTNTTITDLVGDTTYSIYVKFIWTGYAEASCQPIDVTTAPVGTPDLVPLVVTSDITPVVTNGDNFELTWENSNNLAQANYVTIYFSDGFETLTLAGDALTTVCGTWNSYEDTGNRVFMVGKSYSVYIMYSDTLNRSILTEVNGVQASN